MGNFNRLPKETDYKNFIYFEINKIKNLNKAKRMASSQHH